MGRGETAGAGRSGGRLPRGAGRRAYGEGSYEPLMIEAVGTASSASVSMSSMRFTSSRRSARRSAGVSYALSAFEEDVITPNDPANPQQGFNSVLFASNDALEERLADGTADPRPALGLAGRA